MVFFFCAKGFFYFLMVIELAKFLANGCESPECLRLLVLFYVIWTCYWLFKLLRALYERYR
jgi:hypothetical protein